MIAVGVIAIGMGVDHLADGRRAKAGRAFHAGQHLGGQLRVEQCVHQRRCAVTGPPFHDQPGIGPAPAAIGLQPGEQAVADFVQGPGEGRHGWPSSSKLIVTCADNDNSPGCTGGAAPASAIAMRIIGRGPGSGAPAPSLMLAMRFTFRPAALA